ncbi:DUF2780 domain-containing protein [Thaumasiovibrio sp. DFM-14]|uniref:DUF2780 domain-containing protein n=1 Tax=Thaumasiovibrio sp. DFM-14 TaxID=3384792 RepID=UPI0039A0F6D1
MTRLSIFALALGLFTLNTTQAFSLSDLFGSSDEEETTSEVKPVTDTTTDLLSQGSALLVSSEALDNPLTRLLTDQLDINSTQAAGGAGALLALASSSLGSDESSELTSLIPGMDQLTGALPGNLTSMLSGADELSGVINTFNALGIDPALISQFTPIILQFLGDQGASNGLLDSLSSLWTPSQ